MHALWIAFMPGGGRGSFCDRPRRRLRPSPPPTCPPKRGCRFFTVEFARFAIFCSLPVHLCRAHISIIPAPTGNGFCHRSFLSLSYTGYTHSPHQGTLSPTRLLVFLCFSVASFLFFQCAFTFCSGIMPFSVQPLPFLYDALASKGMSKEQITYHYNKHHKGYAVKLNAAVESNPDLASKSLVEVIKSSKGPVFNCAAQIFNHDFFWRCLSPNGGSMPQGDIAGAIVDSFGSFARFKGEFTAVANGHFGSGWAWLVKDTSSGKLKVYQTHDAGCPLTVANLVPILACDIWEHAYYIDYKNDRAAYVNAWWNMVNWSHANRCYREAGAFHYVNSEL
ncbi:iron superoxide dismutase, putative [Leishmania tarentolae]|uniref:Superoxide dismutase [Fe] n=1 Tax=Leishmania tarentolae TaxID=5689 RepID=A0A640KPU7_LEITA|nr:iron superoxide dismutase, putative [Leishmania tarentolae]